MPEIDITKEDSRKSRKRKLRRVHTPILSVDELAEAYTDKHCEMLVAGWEISVPDGTPMSNASLDVLTATSKFLLMQAYVAGAKDRSFRTIHPGRIEAEFVPPKRRDPRKNQREPK